MTRILLAAALASAGCSLALNWDECKTNDDCAGRGDAGVMNYCTLDHLCVSSVPSDQLCTRTIGSTDKNAVVIAGLFNVRDQNGFNDNAAVYATQLGVEDVNQQPKRPIRVVICDTAGDPLQAQRAFIRATTVENAVAVVGPTSSSELAALAEATDPLVIKYPALIVSPAATSPTITTLPDNGLIWRTAASDNLQSKVLATRVPAAPSRVSIAYVDTLYGNGLNESFLAEISGRISDPKSHQYATGTPGELVAADLAADRPNVALLIGDVDVPAWVAGIAAGAADLSSTKILLTDGAKGSALFGIPVLPKTVLDRIEGTAPATPAGKAFDVFRAKYKTRFSLDPADTAFVANTYDAFYAIALAIAVVPMGKAATVPLLAQGMTRLSSPTGQPFDVGLRDYAAAYGALAAGGSINLNGSSGPIDFDANTGDVVSAPIEVWKIDTTDPANPKFETVTNVIP